MIGIYVRISTEEQSRYSISDQLRECRTKVGKNEAKEYIDDGYSGEFLDRPSLAQLRQDVREGLITQIVCLDPDRLARKLMLQLIITDEFDKRGVEIVFINGEYAKTPEGQLFYSMRGAVAEFEKAKINERMSRGRREKARQGRVLRDFRVYGYDFNKETEQLEINPYEAAIVRLIFDLCTKPNSEIKGFNGIAHYLMNQGIPTKRGGNVWHRQVVKQVLMNEAYIGEFYQNKWNSEGMLGNKYRPPEDRIPMKLRPREEWILIPCDPIIDKSQFEHAQMILGESKRRWTKQTRNKYLLSGIIRCGECGNTMSGTKTKHWGKDVLVYTCLKSTAGTKNKGCGRRPQCHIIDNEVWETVHAWLNQPEEIAVAAEEDQQSSTSFEEAEIQRIEKDIEKARTARKRLLRLFAAEEDGLGDEEIRSELREWKEKEDRLVKQLEGLQKEGKDNTSVYNQRILQEAVEYYLTKNPDELTFEDKQQLIRQVVREVRVFKKRIEAYTF